MSDTIREIHSICDAILAHVQRLNPTAATLLQPGLSAEHIAEQATALPFRLPSSVVALYSWRNGTTEGQEIYNHMFLWPWRYLLSLERAIECYSSLKSVRPWKKSLLPLFKSAGGDYIGITCAKDQTGDGEIYSYLQGNDLSKKSPTLTSYLKALLLSYEEGVFCLDEEGALDMNSERRKALADKYAEIGAKP